MNEELIVGLLALAVPLLGGGYFALRNNTGIFRMFVAMVLVGLGYLTVTGALNDIGATILGKAPVAASAEKTAAPAPAEKPAAAAAPVAPAPKVEAPAAPAPAATPPPAAPAPAAPAP
jgi:hypothetical protein